MYSENDELCASIISQAIRNNSDRDDDTRVASSTKYKNKNIEDSVNLGKY